MKNMLALLLSLTIFNVAQAETDIQDLDVVAQRYWLLRAELKTKKEAFDNEENLLANNLKAEIEKLNTELADCPDFACAKIIEQKRTKAEKEWREKREVLYWQWYKIERSAASTAVDLAVSSFAFEASKQVQSDYRVTGYHQNPFWSCVNPYAIAREPLRGVIDWSEGRLCKESVVDFKSAKSVFQVVLSVGLGPKYEVYPSEYQAFDGLDKLFSKSKGDLLDEFSRSLQGIIEFGNASVHVKWHDWQQKYHFDSFESFGFSVRLVQKIPLDPNL